MRKSCISKGICNIDYRKERGSSTHSFSQSESKISIFRGGYPMHPSKLRIFSYPPNLGVADIRKVDNILIWCRDHQVSISFESQTQHSTCQRDILGCIDYWTSRVRNTICPNPESKRVYIPNP